METSPPAQIQTWTFSRVVWATLVLALVAFAFWLIYKFNQVIFVLFVAMVIGTVIRPGVAWLHRHGLPRIAGVILVYFGLISFVIGFLVLLFPLIAEQSGKITVAVPGYYQNLREWLGNYPDQLLSGLGAVLPASLTGLQTAPQTGPEMLASAGKALGYVGSAVEIVFMTLAIFLLAFHWTLDGPRAIQSLLMLVSIEQRDSIRELVQAMETKVGAYIAGQAFLCLIIGIMALIAYLIIGLPNALVLALIAGILEAVPTLGPILGAVPAAVIAFSIEPTKLIWVIVATLIIQQLENSLLVPRVMSKAVGVNPFVSLLAIFAFTTLFGISGALMAIPIAAMIQLLLDRFVFHPDIIEPDISVGRDYASRLRYEAQTLAQGLRMQARLTKGGSTLEVKQIDHVMDEIEALTTDLDALLARVNPPGAS